VEGGGFGCGIGARTIWTYINVDDCELMRIIYWWKSMRSESLVQD
jgi:hypothetical protein